MAKKRCKSCPCLFTLTKRNPDQMYCSKPDCQKARKRREFAALGLYWCNYNAVLKSMETGRKHILRRRTLGLPADFKFRPFTGQAG